MTLRARPVARRRGRAGWDSGDRRNSLINAGFFLAIGISILILIGYAAWSWYDDHFGAAATVNGQVVTKDDVRNRARIEGFRLNYVSQRLTIPRRQLRAETKGMSLPGTMTTNDALMRTIASRPTHRPSSRMLSLVTSA